MSIPRLLWRFADLLICAEDLSTAVQAVEKRVVDPAGVPGGCTDLGEYLARLYPEHGRYATPTTCWFGVIPPNEDIALDASELCRSADPKIDEVVDRFLDLSEGRGDVALTLTMPAHRWAKLLPSGWCQRLE